MIDNGNIPGGWIPISDGPHPQVAFDGSPQIPPR